MQFELTQSQLYLPVTDEAEITFLLRLLPETRKKAAEFPLDIKCVLDRSGSMEEEASGHIKKIDALKEAIKQSLDILRSGQDRICIIVFDDTMQVIVDPQVLNDVSSIKKLIERINTGGSTHLSSPLRYALEVKAVADTLSKVIIFTDGIVNHPSEASEERSCCELARQANQMGIPLAVFGTGIQYNEAFLKKMVELAGRGSYFEHVRQVGAMRLRLEEDLENLKSIQDRDIEVLIQAEPAVKILEAFKYVPQQQELTITGQAAKDEFPGLEARGQAYLVKTKIRANNAVGEFNVATVAVKWHGVTGPESKTLEVKVNFTTDESLISPVDKTVRNTVLNTEAVKSTLRGQFNRAKTLFETAGNVDMAEQVKTLGEGQDEDAKRTLRTKTVTEAHKGTIVEKGGK